MQACQSNVKWPRPAWDGFHEGILAVTKAKHIYLQEKGKRMRLIPNTFGYHCT